MGISMGSVIVNVTSYVRSLSAVIKASQIGNHGTGTCVTCPCPSIAIKIAP